MLWLLLLLFGPIASRSRISFASPHLTGPSPVPKAAFTVYLVPKLFSGQPVRPRTLQSSFIPPVAAPPVSNPVTNGSLSAQVPSGSAARPGANHMPSMSPLGSHRAVADADPSSGASNPLTTGIASTVAASSHDPSLSAPQAVSLESDRLNGVDEAGGTGSTDSEHVAGRAGDAAGAPAATETEGVPSLRKAQSSGSMGSGLYASSKLGMRAQLSEAVAVAIAMLNAERSRKKSALDRADARHRATRIREGVRPDVEGVESSESGVFHRTAMSSPAAALW